MGEKIGFQGNIALPLAELANSYMKRKECNIEFDADMISAGSFVSLLFFLLCHKYGRREHIIAFLNEIYQYIGLSGRDIPFIEAEAIFIKFKVLFDERI